MAKKKYSVCIRWGSDNSDFQQPQQYDFKTKPELKAFMLGVTEANGWLDAEDIHPKKDGSWPDICPHCGSAEIEYNPKAKPRTCPSCEGTGGIGHCNKCNASGKVVLPWHCDECDHHFAEPQAM